MGQTLLGLINESAGSDTVLFAKQTHAYTVNSQHLLQRQGGHRDYSPDLRRIKGSRFLHISCRFHCKFVTVYKSL